MMGMVRACVENLEQHRIEMVAKFAGERLRSCCCSEEFAGRGCGSEAKGAKKRCRAPSCTQLTIRRRALPTDSGSTEGRGGAEGAKWFWRRSSTHAESPRQKRDEGLLLAGGERGKQGDSALAVGEDKMLQVS